jgi:hypothetical protein
MGRPAGFAGGEGLDADEIFHRPHGEEPAEALAKAGVSNHVAAAALGAYLAPVLGRRENKRKKGGQQAAE